MSVLVLDPNRVAQLRAERQLSGADRWDEMWDGVYVITPLANDEHQQVITRIGTVLGIITDDSGLGEVRISMIVSDRREGWEENYRIPDVAVFLVNGKAINCGTHWWGGPDFLVETLSEGERALAKFPFYAQINTREILLIDRDPWGLELYGLWDSQLVQIGSSTLPGSEWLKSSVLPLDFRLVPSEGRPRIEVRHRDGQPWLI